MGRVHARSLCDLAEVSLVAVSDAVPSAAAAVADELGVEMVGPPHLVERHDIEAWVIATPTPTHPAMVRAGLEAGIHLLCEKPLSLDVEEHQELAAAVRAAGTRLQIGFWRRFSPPWRTAKRLIDEGAVGRPLMVRLSQWDANPPPAQFCDPEVSGGLALDCGVHEFDLVEWLTGLNVTTVAAHPLPLVDPDIGAVGDLDNLVAVLGLEGGALATVDLSRNCRYGDDVRTEILGEEGAIFVEMIPHGQTRLATSAGIRVVADSRVEDAFTAGVREQARAFARLVRGEANDHPDAGASASAVAIARLVQKASLSGETLRVAG
jgi:predicted dehydrogenase